MNRCRYLRVGYGAVPSELVAYFSPLHFSRNIMRTHTRASALGALLVAANGANAFRPGTNGSPWDLKNFSSLVVFGDSYTDDSRLGYFINNNGSAPPTGWVDPVVSDKTASC